MRELYLHYLFLTHSLGSSFKTIDGTNIEILSTGELNENAGPDFLNARLRIGEMNWIGNVEFHVRSSDWYTHNHQNDPAYNTVVAHFVYEHDQEVRILGSALPTVELKHLINPNHYLQYGSLAKRKRKWACSDMVSSVGRDIIGHQFGVAFQMRLRRKADSVWHLLQGCNGDIERTFYLLTARVFGSKVNADSFEHLLRSLDLRQLQRTRNNELSTPAIVLGCSGLLPSNSKDKYVEELTKEFLFQRHRLNLRTLNPGSFRFSSMHPAGFPTRRLAQLAELIRKSPPVSQLISESLSLEGFYQLLQIQLPDFWQTHMHFNHPAKQKLTNGLSMDFLDRIILNVIVPMRYALLKEEGNVNKQLLTELIRKIKPESNSVVRTWLKAGVDLESAYDSQAVLEQSKNFCAKKRCLQCLIGKDLLGTRNDNLE